MQNYSGTIDTDSPVKISQTDKLMFCAFLALAFHAMLLFGIGFKLPDSNPDSTEKTFNVVLAQFASETKPEKADFIGQANQEGGGESDQLIAPSAKEMAQFNDPDQIASEYQAMQAELNPSQPDTETISVLGGDSSQSSLLKQNESETASQDTAELINRSYQLSGLIANLDNQNNNQAKKGRKRAVSASIHRATDALYLDTWRRKIERIGNLNYPEKAKRDQIYGNLTMKVSLNRDGTIHDLTITESSGHKILDDAAIRIVRLAAPFAPLTSEMTADTDILEIIRVWRFQPDYRLQTQ